MILPCRSCATVLPLQTSAAVHAEGVNLRRGEPYSVHAVPVRTLQLFDLVGAEVLQSERIGFGSIRLHLSNGMFVEFLQDSSEYECYTIRTGNSEIVV